MQWGFSDALPQTLVQLFLFKKPEFYSLKLQNFLKIKILGVLAV